MKLVDRYIQLVALRGLALAGAGLTALLSMLDFIEQLQDVGKGHYHVIDAFIYTAFTAPSRLLSVVPPAALIGSLVALGALANDNELTAMRSAGLSPLRIIWAVLKLGAVVMVALFLMAEFVVPSARQHADARRAMMLSPGTVFRSDNGFWARDANRYLNVRRLLYDSIPSDIDIYSFGNDGHLSYYIHSQRADILPSGIWMLYGVRRETLNQQKLLTENIKTLPWTSFLRPAQVQLLVLPPESMSPTALYHYINDLKIRHQYAQRYRHELWDKISIPFAAAAMVLLAVPLVFGSSRRHSIGQRIAVGSIIGITFYLINQISSYTGLLLDLNPILTSLSPSLLVLFVDAHLLAKTA